MQDAMYIARGFITDLSARREVQVTKVRDGLQGQP